MGTRIGVITGDARSLDENSYIPINPSFHFIFPVLFQSILHSRGYKGRYLEFRP